MKKGKAFLCSCIWLLSILLLPVSMLYGQASPLFSWQAQGCAGGYISHRSKRTVPEQLQAGFSLDCYKRTPGSKYWQFAHNYPNMGLSLTARSLGNASVYGSALSLLPYLEFNLISGTHGALQVKHGTGLAYVTKRYREQNNPQNILLSTHLNATSILDIGYRYYLTPQWDVKAGILVQHYSNGGFRLPNTGMNTAAAYIGAAYNSRGREVEKTRYQAMLHFVKWRYRLGMALGFYDYRSGPAPSVKLNTQINAMVFRQHNTRFRTGLGIELGHLTYQRVQTAVYIEEEVQFAHITTRYGFGGYLIHKNPSGEDFYSKIGLAYYPQRLNMQIPGKLYIGSMLKAHGTKAAHIELTAGFVF